MGFKANISREKKMHRIRAAGTKDLFPKAFQESALDRPPRSGTPGVTRRFNKADNP